MKFMMEKIINIKFLKRGKKKTTFLTQKNISVILKFLGEENNLSLNFQCKQLHEMKNVQKLIQYTMTQAKII